MRKKHSFLNFGFIIFMRKCYRRFKRFGCLKHLKNNTSESRTSNKRSGKYL